jgi:2-polyprenyl-6-methoxyphenol hydroxylase-like FAD-dependent oxidoreductase
MTKAVDVLVVGAGPVGMTLALGLTSLGLDVRIIDRAPHTKHQARAGIVWPRAAEVLDDLGAGPQLEKMANLLRSVDLYASGRHLGALDMGHIDSRYPLPMVIEQHETERLLAQTLAEKDVLVEWNHELVGLRSSQDGVKAILRSPDGEQTAIEAAWVVGCEGTRSRVREAAGITYPGKPRHNLQVLQINANPRWRHQYDPSHGWFFLEPNASLGVSPIPGGGYRFFLFTTDPDPSQIAPPTVEQMCGLVARLSRQPDLTLTPTEPYWVNRARFQDRIATTFRRGRVLLAGDAAHAWAPIGGHGMNTGMRGAHNLAWKLAAVHTGQAHDVLLDTYDTEQRAAAHAVMDEMRFNVIERPMPAALYWPVISALRLTLVSTAARRKVERKLSDLDMHHRSSALSVDIRRASGPRAGDRIPDAAITTDQPTRFHDLLSYDRWTLLTRPTASIATIQNIVDKYRSTIRVVPISQPAERTQVSEDDDTLLLVRPDRHIGLRATSTDFAALNAYCHKHLTKR